MPMILAVTSSFGKSQNCVVLQMSQVWIFHLLPFRNSFLGLEPSVENHCYTDHNKNKHTQTHLFAELCKSQNVVAPSFLSSLGGWDGVVMSRTMMGPNPKIGLLVNIVIKQHANTTLVWNSWWHEKKKQKNKTAGEDAVLNTKNASATKTDQERYENP